MPAVGTRSRFLIQWVSRRTGFVLCVALTIVCLLGTVVFALYAMPSMVFGFAALTAILAGTSVYAGWDWKKSGDETTGSLK
jgi:hypothetical protein